MDRLLDCIADHQGAILTALIAVYAVGSIVWAIAYLRVATGCP